jgi:hypothetical protein
MCRGRAGGVQGVCAKFVGFCWFAVNYGAAAAGGVPAVGFLLGEARGRGLVAPQLWCGWAAVLGGRVVLGCPMWRNDAGADSAIVVPEMLGGLGGNFAAR